VINIWKTVSKEEFNTQWIKGFTEWNTGLCHSPLCLSYLGFWILWERNALEKKIVFSSFITL
jgi:hypothetical protein